MLALSIRSNIREVSRGLSDVARKQIPYAAALAVNDLAFRAMRAENAALKQIFKHPRPFTQRATQVERKATKAKPFALVSIRRDRQQYLLPYETGGVHYTAGKALLNPKDIKLDAFGQMAKGLPKRLAARTDVFVGTVHGVTGFWQRLPVSKSKARLPAGVQRMQLRLLIRLGRPMPVRQHLDFQKRGAEVVKADAPAAVRAALTRALRTRR